METVLKNIGLNEIIESSTNPRKQYDDTAIAELAESIKEQGVIQPVVVRPINGIKALTKNDRVQYELVCGSRRFRASKLAGNQSIPAVVRALNDEEAFELQITENLQRQDVHPLDEAEAIAKLLEHGLNTKTVAHRLGKSSSYVLRRLKLAQLTDSFKEAFYANKVFIGQALLIAGLEQPLQEKIFEEDFSDWQEDHFDPRDVDVDGSVQYELGKLDSAPFDTTDENLYPEAGACTRCPFNSAVSQYLFPELNLNSELGNCSKRSCYDVKTDAHLEKMLQECLVNPNIVPVIHYRESEKNNRPLSRAKDLGFKTLMQYRTDFTIIEAPDAPDEVPSIEQIMDNFDESRQDATWRHKEWEKSFKEEMAEYELALKNYNEALANPNQLKGYFLNGSNAGQILPIKLKSKLQDEENQEDYSHRAPAVETVESLTQQLNSVINKIELAKLSSQKECYKVMLERLEAVEHYQRESIFPLTQSEKKAFVLAMIDQGTYELTEYLRENVKQIFTEKNEFDVECEIDQSLLNLIARRFIFESLKDDNIGSPGQMVLNQVATDDKYTEQVNAPELWAEHDSKLLETTKALNKAAKEIKSKLANLKPSKA